MKKIIILSLYFTNLLNAQTSEIKSDTLSIDSVAQLAIALEEKIPQEFKVYTKLHNKKDHRVKLCVNLVSPENIYNLCINDSICTYPEVYKILFERKIKDSTFVLVYVDAYSKPKQVEANCNSGKETKLFFIRWNTKTNQASWKQKTISSCLKGITNLTKESILDWDKVSVLKLSYYRGGDEFIDLQFDPKNLNLGFQSLSD